MNAVLMLLLFLILGYLTQRILSESKQLYWADRFNQFVIYISLPSLVFVTMADLTVDSRFMLPIASAWGLFVFSVAILLFFARLWGWSRSITGALLMVIPIGNTSFLGIPFTKAFFGETGVPYAIVYDQLGSFLILSTVGIVILSLYSSQKTTAGRILYRIFTFPSFVALILAFSIPASLPPAWFITLLEYLAATLTPFALISIGLHLKLKIEPGRFQPFGAGLFIKLLLAPAILLGVLIFLNINTLSAHVSIFEAAMAPMVSSSMLAIEAGLERRFVASILGYGIIISFGTLPLWFRLITGVL